MKKIIAIFLTLVLSFSIVSCGGNAGTAGGENPPAEQGTPLGTTTVTVAKSTGYMMENVFVFLYDENGDMVARGRTDYKGEVTFNLDKPRYTLKLEEIPLGYVAEPSYTLDTNNLKITLGTQLIPEESGLSSYRVGDVCQDFTFTDYQGNSVKLSDLLKEKEFVVLNFWYVNCSFCIKEFPYLNEAYLEYSDRIEVLAINNLGESDEQIAAFKDKHSLDMPIGRDNCSMYSKFGLGGAPSTVIIDSDGVVRFSHTGAYTTTQDWRDIFDTYLSK